MSHVTIRDIAHASGFSIATVSLALRDHPRISKQTRSVIQLKAADMGYRPNPMMAAHWCAVRSRQPAGFQSVIAVINDWDYPERWQNSAYIKPILAEFHRRADALGYQVEEFAIGENQPLRDAERLTRLKAMARVFRARGIHAFAVYSSAHPHLFSEAAADFANFATIFVDSAYLTPSGLIPGTRHTPFHQCGASVYSNMILLLDQLRALGYRRPGYWPNQWSELGLGGEAAAAFNFYIKALPEMDRIPVNWTGWNPAASSKTFHSDFLSWLESGKPDVVICGNLEVRSWLESTGRRIPQDIGLAHVDLSPSEPGWSGIDQRHDRIAAAAVDVVTAHLSRNERGIPEYPKNLRIEGQWVPGTTVRRQD